MIKPGDEPIPGYRLEALLGRGQFGQVWRARSPGNTSLALKFLELTGTHGWKEFRAIQRVKQIRHAHLMPIVAIWLLDEHGQVISDDAMESIAASHQDSAVRSATTETLVVEPIKQTRRPAQLVVATLLANQTLGDRLRECQADGRQGIPVDELLGYMDEAAKGLDYLNLSEHKIGASLGMVQHCDVKPDNIMLAGGSVVISDFGVAQTLAQARVAATGTSLGGTPAYMAPECFSNKPCKATDQYSLAVSYYELRTGKLPFEEQTYAAVYKAHHDGSLDFSACKPAEQQVLRMATATDPNQRFASCAELVEALTEAVRPAPKPQRGTSRRFWPVAAVLAAIAGSVAVAAIALRDRGNETIVGPPKALAKVTVVVDPADADVTVDGKPVALDSGGRAVILRELGRSLTIHASRSPERREGGVTIESVQRDEQHTITLPYSASHFADEADRFLEDGRFEEATAVLAEAIKLEPDQFAKLPEPMVCLAGDEPVECLRLSASGQWLIAGSRDGAVRRWPIDSKGVNIDAEIVHRHESEVKELAATDRWTASLAEDGDGVMLSQSAGQTLELTLPPESGDIARVAVTGGGRWLLAASELMALPPERRITALYAWDLEQSDVARSRKELATLVDEVEPRLAAAHDQSWAALSTTDGESYMLRLFAVDAPKADQNADPVYKQSGELAAIAVSPDDRWIAVGGGSSLDEPELFDYRATLINAQSRRLQTLDRGHSDSIAAIAFDAAGNFMATGGADGRALAWTIPDDWDASQPLASEPVFLDDHKEPVTAIACPEAGWPVCNHEGKAVLWDCKPDATASIVLPTATAAVTAMASTPDGQWIVTGHDDGTVRLWPLPRLKMVMRACAMAGTRPLSLEAAADKITRYDRAFRLVPRSLLGNGETGRRRASRPTAMHGG